MKTKNYIQAIACLLLALALAISSATAKKPLTHSRIDRGGNEDRPQLIAPIETWDGIVHNGGNIATAIYNYGSIGAAVYGEPSGEWPRNSGRDYLAEIRYWMGATTASGDTLVANTVDDFQAIPMPINEVDQYRIYLSTDTSRYYRYNPTDTIGLAAGSPAHGWRVWNHNSEQYAYNEKYDPLATAYSPAGPTSLQDSHYRFNDGAKGESLLGLELTQSVYQWNYCYNEDFMFVVLEITNTSTEDYGDFALGLYIDIDVGGLDGAGENGRLEDLVAFDSTENLAWIYDNIGRDPGWGPTVPTGIMGTKYLETPDNIGMTAFRSDDWAIVTDMSDEERYALINSEQYDQSLPPTDQFYIQATKGIDLTAGKTVRVVFALIAGQDEDDFRDNASLAQSLYDGNFLGPQPPATPILSARPGDRKVYLHWSDTSEVSLDPLSGEADFVGYKLYRSDNRGLTWGVVNYNTGNDCLTVDYLPLAQYSVNNAGDPIPRSYIDTGLYNGVEYWYCLAAFDRGDTTVGVDPLQSGFGVAGTAPNVAAVRPQEAAAGFYEAASTVTHNAIGVGLPSDGQVAPFVFDDAAATGDNYEVVFEDLPDATVWHLVNVTSGDTVLANQTRQNGDPELFDVADGIRVAITNGDRVSRGQSQTAFSGGDTTIVCGDLLEPAIAYLTNNPANVWSDRPFRADYEIRFTDNTSRASWLLAYWYGELYEYQVPFEVWNTTTNEQVTVDIWDLAEDGVWNVSDPIAIVDYPYDGESSVTEFAFPLDYAWVLEFNDSLTNPATGDVFAIQGAPLNGPNDVFSFSPDGVNTARVAAELNDIRVVPDPYFGRYHALAEPSEGESVIQFKGIPERCTIRIYTLAGELVRTLDHEGSGETDWNLLSEARRQVASGIYLYHVESAQGDHLGRFAVIK